LLGISCLIVSFTGKASVAVNGMTINSAFKIPLNLNDYKPLSGKNLRNMQINFADIT
jgi:hypothetical protein